MIDGGERIDQVVVVVVVDRSKSFLLHRTVFDFLADHVLLGCKFLNLVNV